MSDISVQTTNTDNLDLTNLDSVVKSILHKFADRADFGKKKYGTDLDRSDLKTLDWINHAQEELMDGILYLEKLKRSFPEKNSNVKKDKVFDDYTNCKYYRT